MKPELASQINHPQVGAYYFREDLESAPRIEKLRRQKNGGRYSKQRPIARCKRG